MNQKVRALRAKVWAAAVFGLLLGLFPTLLHAQTVIVGSPVPRVVYQPVVSAPPNTVVAPAAVSVFSPVLGPPMGTFRPIVVERPAVTVYSPVVAPVPVVVTQQPVVVRPKVYVPGQPIRNVLRAITP